MVKKNDNTIFWIIGIILFIIIFPKIPLISHGAFSVVTTTTCSSGVTNYYSLDGNLLDSQGNLNLINHDSKFISGKLGSGALEFNTTNYVSFPSVPSGNIFMWIKNYSNNGSDWYYASYVNGTNVDATKPIIMPSSTFGLNFNGSIDEITITTNSITSGFSTIQACYQTTQQVNISCYDYYLTQNLVNSSGSLLVSGDYFPNCSYIWQPAQYSINNNICSKNLLYSSSCLASSGCYNSNQNCIENLKYSCFVLNNNICTEKTDYTSCKVNTTNTYLTSSECNSKIVATPTSPASVVPSSQTATQPSASFIDLINKEIFNIGGYSLTSIHLLLILVLIIGAFYLLSKKGGR